MASSSLTFLGIPGSLRAGSHSLAALEAMRPLLPRNVQLKLFDPQLLPLSRHHDKPAGLVRGQNDQIAELKRQIRAADAVVLAVPEYLYGVTTVMNDIMDCAAHPAHDNALLGKPVAVIGVSSSRRSAAHAQEHVRRKLHALGMRPVDQPEVLVRTSYTTSFFGGPRPRMDEAARALVCEVLASLVSAMPDDGTTRIAKMVLTSGSLHFGRHTAQAPVQQSA